MKTFIQYWKDRSNEDIPNEIPGTWFSERGLPMIVACCCCGMTMALPSAVISDDEYIYCESCAEV